MLVPFPEARVLGTEDRLFLSVDRRQHGAGPLLDVETSFPCWRGEGRPSSVPCSCQIFGSGGRGATRGSRGAFRVLQHPQQRLVGEYGPILLIIIIDMKKMRFNRHLSVFSLLQHHILPSLR